MHCKKCFYFLFILFTSGLVGQDDVRKTSDFRPQQADIEIQNAYIRAIYATIVDKSKQAILILDTIRREHPELASVYFEKAKVYMHDHNYPLAAPEAKTAMEKDPENEYFHTFYADILSQLKQYDQALGIYQALIQNNPKNGTYYQDGIELAEKAQKYDIGIQLLNVMEQNFGTSEGLYIQKAEFYDHMDNFDAAANEIKKLIELYPDDVNNYKLLANLYRSYDKNDEALRWFQQAATLDPNDSDAKMAIITLGGKTGSESESYLTTLLPLIRNKSIPLDAKIKEVYPYLQQQTEQKLDSASVHSLLEVTENIVITHPNEAKAHAVYGDALMNAGRYSAAISQYERTLELNKKNYMVWEQLMYGLEHMADYQRLKTISTDALDYYPTQAMVYYFQAIANIETGNASYAKEMIADGTKVAAGNAFIGSKMDYAQALYAFKSNDPDTEKWIKKAIESSASQNYLAWILQGDYALTKNKTQDAKKAYQTALSLSEKNDLIIKKIQNLPIQ